MCTLAQTYDIVLMGSCAIGCQFLLSFSFVFANGDTERFFLFFKLNYLRTRNIYGSVEEGDLHSMPVGLGSICSTAKTKQKL